MQALSFFSQSEETDADGFFLQGEAALDAERRALRAAGAPDVEALVLLRVEALDRDSAEVEALVTDAFAEWARKEDIVNE